MRKILLLLAMFMGFSFLAFSQTRTVTGTVVDEAANPVPFASVSIKGTDTGVSADADGNFSINASVGSTLVFSATGFTTIEVTVRGNTVNAVLTKGEGQVIDEVIVTAYGKSTKSTFTGAATAINAEAIERRPLTSITKALDGAAPGVVSTLGSGQPGANAGVRIRGFGSINASADPLYVVDGVPFKGDLNSINPNDVENITVLKDAAASTLYGSRAANGVVMITTKSGRNTAGKINVNFKANVGVASRAVKRYDVMNAQEYLETVFMAYKNQEIFEKGIPERYGRSHLWCE
jgi:TonB-dependent SusC/RagA subfamily outer membrane receptor